MNGRLIKLTIGFVLLLTLGLIILTHQMSKDDKDFVNIDRNSLHNAQSEIIYQKPISDETRLIRYRTDEDHLVIVYKDGTIKIIEPLSGNEISSKKIEWSGSQKADMDEEGRFLIGALKSEFDSSIDFSYREYIGGIRVWNIDQGEIILCIDDCDEESLTRRGASVVNVTISPDGNWVLEHDFSGWYIKNLKKPRFYRSGSVTAVFDDGRIKVIGKIAISPNGKRFVIARQQGFVRLYDFPDETNFRELDVDTKILYTEVKDIKFSPNGEKIARIFQDKISIWNNKLWFENKDNKWEFNLEGALQLAFDESGEYLFVSTEKTIEVYDTKDLKNVVSFSTPGIRCFQIRQDNKFLYWGDQNGIVYEIKLTNDQEK